MINIYFAGSIRGGRQLAGRYSELIEMLRTYGHVHSEHVGDDMAIEQDKKLSDRQIHERDLEWIGQSDKVVAEVSVPSLGVGYEIAYAIRLGKPVLCLYDENSEYRLSAMISGSDDIKVRRYNSLGEARSILDKFMEGIR